MAEGDQAIASHWLPKDLHQLLSSVEDPSDMEAFPVQTTVNNPRNEGPECLLPFE